MMWNPCSPTSSPGLFAQVVLDTETYLVAFGLIVLIVAGGYAVLCVKRWRREDLEKPTLHEQLAGYEQLQEQGLLLPQELERIKARLADKARQESDEQFPSASSTAAQPTNHLWPIPPADRGGPSHG